MQEPRELKITQLDIEVYNWKTGDYVADFSDILSNGLRVNWKLNSTEEFEFGLDYEQFKNKCEEMGVLAAEVLSPGVHDIRIRYNGKYIVGGRVIQADININNSASSTLQVKCLGFLDLMRNQLTNAQYGRKTYAQIARSLVMDSQKALPINKTTTPAVNASGWVCGGRKNGADYRLFSTTINDYMLKVAPINTSGNSWCSLSTRIKVPAGTRISLSWRQSIPTNALQAKVVERKELGYWEDQVVVKYIERSTITGNWVYVKQPDYFTESDNPWIRIEVQGPPDSFLAISDFKITYHFDQDRYYEKKILLGVDTASASQKSNRLRAYELQNVKDAIVNLTKLENDNFDFEFTPDRRFNTYARKGQEKDIEVSYPGNLDSGTVSRTVADVVNYSYAIGSGIGDERIEAVTHSSASRNIYGTEIGIKSHNDVKLFSTLYEHSLGEVQQNQWRAEIPDVTVSDASINPSTLETGDIIRVRFENDPYLASASQSYRVIGINWTINNDMGETMSLSLVKYPKPVKKPVMIRYIKDIVQGNTVNAGNHWVSVEAIEMDGDKEIDRARGKTVTGYPSITNGQRAVDGDNSAGSYAYTQDGVKGVIMVDLGQPYPIDYIRIRYHYSDKRLYHLKGASAGLTSKPGYEPLDIPIWRDATVRARPEGRKSRWLQLENS